MFTSSHRALDSALLHLHGHEPVSWIDPQEFGRGLAAGTLRREWTWLAFVDTTPVARGVWWGPVGSVHPVALRCLVVDETLPHPEVWAAALIRSAHRAFAEAGALLVPDLVVEASADPADASAVAAALAWRRLAAADAGLPAEQVLESVAPSAVAERATDAGPASERVTRHTFSSRSLTVPHPRVLAGAGR
ncbi:hypothetical protein N1031_16720 [Herbiconiux moechotypicola]|uniref:GNAT family N-acetyltransferase n=1 Tax=Herbiconiux moechotypicola TaxID=637393 RepID=A0ABP5QKW9_9MICO|nr:hypothetical protein [Herbiconiux moechotypicola]MCS5731407.1 hypothetical protein [Herbiconiux moechotypicola]